MAQPYVGEVRMFAGSFAPAGWQFCNGALLAISEYETLFNLIGTTYGGDGQETFAVPDLQGRLPLHMGTGSGLSNYQLAQAVGVETVQLSVNQIPSHTHNVVASTDIATIANPSNAFLAQSSVAQMYLGDVTDSTMAANSIGQAGGSQPHDNFQPYLCVSFIISLFGIFPSPT
jgi:microcystin-dependent protein